MPAKSQAQFRAMEAAAHGHSTLSIPANVGAEYVRADTGRNLKALPVRTKRPLKARIKWRHT